MKFELLNAIILKWSRAVTIIIINTKRREHKMPLYFTILLEEKFIILIVYNQKIEVDCFFFSL